ncbi:replication protein A subunit RPA32 [Laetiporus sulphureus 93-53]|uniref:Replication protein A subunit RPA32 n=1 Tax=Laetiporus sulphureus 93-53 TaxID=1314785 RepID=A0A165BW02_9APHY|nr:replication protein A subunit RPA32 [Laetiporus sulphureus 93-53]KZT01754.1 replication protein A subunit RPA32 [Laetiporus sulphureus 93-53]
MAGSSPFGSASGTPGDSFKRGAAMHTLRPVLIRQLLMATQPQSEGPWMINDHEVGQVSVVGCVVSIKRQAMTCIYWLDDGTERIEAWHWLDGTNEDDTERWGGVKEAMYVYVMGSLKSFGNKRYINANHIRKVTDTHEVLSHVSAAMVVTLMLERGPPLRPSEAGSIHTTNGGVTNQLVGSSVYVPQAQGGLSREEYARLSPVQRKIVEFMVVQPPKEEGINVGAIAKALSGDVKDAAVISEALDKLMDEGLVYTTIDECHFSLANV